MELNELNDKAIHGRGAALNPPNRFERLHLELDENTQIDPNDDDSSIRTEFYKDKTTKILTHNDSPDVGFDTSLNPYRGCEHGCIYCYARPTHEYLGYSAGLDFETKIFVKEDAPILLREELSSPKWKPRVVAMSGVTDCYQPVERRLKLTRKCLEVFAEFRNPVVIITKNHLVTRDVDLLKELAKAQAVAVFISVTTLDDELARVMEPRTSQPKWRINAIETLSKADIPVGVLVAPILPGLTDHEILPILKRTTEAGAQFAGYTVLRLPYGVKDLFDQWLSTHFPDRSKKVLDRIRSIRNGKLNDSDFNTRMKGQGIFAEQIRDMFKVGCQKTGILGRSPKLSVSNFKRPAGPQLELNL
jgi:DNA repair photolyase